MKALLRGSWNWSMRMLCLGVLGVFLCQQIGWTLDADTLAPPSAFSKSGKDKSSPHLHASIIQKMVASETKPILFSTPQYPNRTLRLRMIPDHISAPIRKPMGNEELQMLFVESVSKEKGVKPYPVGMATHIFSDKESGEVYTGWFLIFDYKGIRSELDAFRERSSQPMTYMEAMSKYAEQTDEGALVMEIVFLYPYLDAMLREKKGKAATDEAFLEYMDNVPAPLFGSGIDTAIIEYLSSYMPHGTVMKTFLGHAKSLALIKAGVPMRKTPIYRWWQRNGFEVVGSAGDGSYILKKIRPAMIRSRWEDPSMLGAHARFARPFGPRMDMDELLAKARRRILFSTPKIPERQFRLRIQKDVGYTEPRSMILVETIPVAKGGQPLPIGSLSGLYMDENGVLHVEGLTMLEGWSGKGIEEALGEFLTSFAPIHSTVLYTPTNKDTVQALERGKRFEYTLRGRSWARLGYEVLERNQDGSFLLSKTFPGTLKTIWEKPEEHLGRNVVSYADKATERYLTREGQVVVPLTHAQASALDPLYASVDDYWGHQEDYRADHANAKVVYFVRHMESTSNVLHFTQHSTMFSPPTARGKRQAEALVSLLKDVPFGRWMASDSERAYKTILPLARKKGAPHTLKVDSRLREVAFWPVGGMPFAEARDAFKEMHRVFYEEVETFATPGVRSFEESFNGLASLMREISQSEEEPTLLGAHGMSLLFGIMAASDIPLAKYWAVRKMLHLSPNVGVSILAYDPDQDSWQLLVYADNSYLQEDLRGPGSASVWTRIDEMAQAAIRKTVDFLFNIRQDALVDYMPSWEVLLRPTPGKVKAALDNMRLMEVAL